LIPLLTLGAGNVPDNFDGGIFRVVVLGFFLHGGEGAEELVGDVGEDGGAAGADAVLGEKEQQAGEEVVDGGSGGEFGETVGEGVGEIGGFAAIFGEFGVAGAEAGVGVVDQDSAAFAIGELLAAAGRVVEGTGFSCFGVH